MLDADGVARSVELLIERGDDVWPQLMTLLVDPEKREGVIYHQTGQLRR